MVTPRKKPIAILEDTEVVALMDACNRGPTGLRNRALIALLRGSAVRVSEATALEAADLSLRRLQVQVRYGKGSKERTVGLAPSAVPALEPWLRAREELVERGAPLFCTLAGGAVHRGYVYAMLRRLARRAGVEARVHPHGLRHTAADAMRRSGADLKVIQDQLGHSTLATTEIYVAHLSPRHLTEAMAAADMK